MRYSDHCTTATQVDISWLLAQVLCWSGLPMRRNNDIRIPAHRFCPEYPYSSSSIQILLTTQAENFPGAKSFRVS